MAVVGVEGLGCLELGLGACCSGKGLLSFLFLFFFLFGSILGYRYREES